MIDNSSGMSVVQANLLQNFPALHQRRSESLPGGLPNLHIAVISSDMGAGDGIDQRLLRRRRQRRHLPVHPARDLRLATPGMPARRSFATSTASRTTPATSRTCSPASRPLATRLRLRAPARRRWRAPSAPTAGRRRPRTRASCARTRSWSSCCSPTRTTAPRRRGARCSTRPTQPEPRLAARSPGQLPLQRVRSPVQRRQAAPARAERERERRRHAGRLRVGRRRGHADAARDAARADPIAETVPRRADPGHGDRRAERAVHR